MTGAPLSSGRETSRGALGAPRPRRAEIAFEADQGDDPVGSAAATPADVEERLRVYQETLRSFAAQLTVAEERERRRIADDLHDRIVQVLGLSRIKIGELRERLGASPELDELRTLIELAIRETRSLLFDLSPPILYELGLADAVEWLAERAQEEAGSEPPAIQVDDDGRAKPLPDHVRIVLFQTIRELLLNVRKHAHASRVVVSLRGGGERLRVTVEDDGVGFDPAALLMRRPAGFGLFSIRERIELLGGSLRIASAVGAGTEVEIRVPVRERRGDGAAARSPAADADGA